ncbi:MAG: hypothetical protein ABSB59_35130 [Streptosporangiaceae bacterium]
MIFPAVYLLVRCLLGWLTVIDCVDSCLKPLSLGLSLTPPGRNHYMSHPLSVRLNDATIARLGRHAQRAHLAPRTLAQRYVEEGLRMDEHPLIRFADGPAGRRARLVGTGKDVWEIIATVRDNDGDAAGTARYLEIPLGLVQAAIGYYGAYREEIVRLLLDEMLSPAIARERRAVVTSNPRDYRPLHADAITPDGPGHSGMTFMPGTYRRTRQDTGRIIAALEAKLTEYPGDEDLANGECWL